MELEPNAPLPSWVPPASVCAMANLTRLMHEVSVDDYEDLHRWSVSHRDAFWGEVVRSLGILFDRPFREVLRLDHGVEVPQWFFGSSLNIVESCLSGDPERRAIVHRRNGENHTVTLGSLRGLVGRAVMGFSSAGFEPGDRIAIAMPMTLEAVVAYLGVIAAGGVVVSIADSFAPHEIATRLRISGAVGAVTQDVIHRAGKTLPMYEKVAAAGAERVVVVSTGAAVELRPGDIEWSEFIGARSDFDGDLRPHHTGPDAFINILFSSGTTGDPKAIPWTQSTPIKAAMDGKYHQDIHPDDLVAWPTNIGWMMGPWLIFAPLINGASFALYDDAPGDRGFGRFVEEAGVTILGVVPSLVAAWRSSRCMEGLDWSSIRLFSSTGEASNADDMAYLMDLAGTKPVIEYCGGTEIGGGYITGTVLQPAVPATFTTPALGMDIRILDESGRPSDDGELFLVPPSVGLSTVLLNRDHHAVYYADVPGGAETLRRHGDRFQRLPGGRYRAVGRVDDAMNLGGIKVGSAEIERCAAAVPGIKEVAAIAVSPPAGGPSSLVLFVVPDGAVDPPADRWKGALQEAIRNELNPLFKVGDVVVVRELPRTASAKVMRRVLRTEYDRAHVD